MYKRLFPRMAFCLTLITSFLFMPFSAVYADGLTQDSEYWKWWYIENITDAITDGDAASADNLTDTYNGSTVGKYVYDQTGLTADDIKEYVQQQYENAEGYVEHTAEWYSSAIDDIWNSSIDAGTKAKYQAEKALRETVDTAGKAVYNVSSSDYWSNVYNDIFNSGGYKDQYETPSNDSYNTSINNVNYTFSKYGVYYIAGNEVQDAPISGTHDGVDPPIILNNGKKNGDAIVTYSGGYVKLIGNPYAVSEFTINNITYDDTRNAYLVLWNMERSNGELYDCSCYLNLNSGFTGSNVTEGGTPVLKPKQVGYVMHNGVKYPVYTDPSLNPFKVNDNGTVTFNDGSGDEPIYIDPTELTDDGSLDILKWLDNDNLTENPYNPYGKPWNTQPDGSVLGGFFSNLIKDISSIFDGIAKTISNLIDKIIKAIKDIANIIIDALKSFWELLIGDVDEYATLFETDVNDNFDMISDLYELLLECMGVDA